MIIKNYITETRLGCIQLIRKLRTLKDTTFETLDLNLIYIYRSADLSYEKIRIQSSQLVFTVRKNLNEKFCFTHNLSGKISRKFISLYDEI